SIHHQRNFDRQRTQFQQQLPPHGSIVRFAWRQAENYCRSSIRGNQMNFGVPSAARFPDGLRSVFFKAPVPSGCTFTEVESKLKASILNAQNLLLLQLGEHLIQDTFLSPTIHAHIDAMPVAKSLSRPWRNCSCFVTCEVARGKGNMIRGADQ